VVVAVVDGMGDGGAAIALVAENPMTELSGYFT
jgi:hypothetical protein